MLDVPTARSVAPDFASRFVRPQKASTLTVAQRKLAKTDIKGMKTMASFFGKK